MCPLLCIAAAAEIPFDALMVRGSFAVHHCWNPNKSLLIVHGLVAVRTAGSQSTLD